MTDEIEAESSPAIEEAPDVKTEESQDTSPDDNGTMVEAITKALEEEAPGTVEEEDETEEEPDSTDETKDDVPETSGDEKEPDLHDMPEGLKPKSEERFQNLVSDNKSKGEYIDQANEALTNMQTAVTQTGLDAEGFGQLLDFARMTNSTNMEDRESAFNVIKSEYQRQAQALGKKIEGFDSLTDRPDLRGRVDDLELSEDDALKIAHAERVVAQHNEAGRQSEQRILLENQSAREQQVALDSVGNFMESMERTDIDFAHKNSKLMSMVEDIRAGYPSSQWGSVVKHLYGVMGTSSDKRIANKKSVSNPVVSSGASAGVQTPSTMLEAINQALDADQ